MVPISFKFSTTEMAHESGAQLHILALRTLLALGWKGTPDFWRSQKELVGQHWPEIIFKGLVLHDLRMGFEALPELIASQEAMRGVRSGEGQQPAVFWRFRPRGPRHPAPLGTELVRDAGPGHRSDDSHGAALPRQENQPLGEHPHERSAVFPSLPR
jgi:hypothetical protein